MSAQLSNFGSKHMKAGLFIVVLIAFLQSCTPHLHELYSTSVPSSIDYSIPSNWAAHPSQEDQADRAPKGLENKQSEALVDVFFLHPTTLVKKPKLWNASIEDAKVNQKTDETSILYQASIFNESARVFAPRYRQAHLHTFYSKDTVQAKKALDLAYEDIRSAFEYFLENENQNRPIIIAGHSQGALHGKRLLEEFFENKPIKKRLVVAYLVGWPVLKQEYSDIPPCETPHQTGCVCSWRTFKHGFTPKKYFLGDSILVTNPLSWKTDKTYVPKEQSQGAVLRDFDTILPQIMDAQVENGMLWSHKPKFPGSILFIRRNYHIGDLNLFYMDVRENVRQRVDAFWK